MSIRYKIPFMPLRSNEQLEVCVYDDNYSSSTAYTLQGAAEPIITEEDDDTDFFKPVRIQTGYINVKDQDGWLGLLPGNGYTSRPVVLRRASNSQVLWAGFIQQQQEESELYGYHEERSLAIYDVLGVLEFIYFRPLGNQATTNQYINFASLIKTIVDSIPSAVRPTDFYFQGYNHIKPKLLAKVNPQLFFDMQDDVFTVSPSPVTMENLKCRYTCREVLEEVCKFWSLSCHSDGMSLYFVQDYVPGVYGGNDYGHEPYLHLTYAELTTMAGGTEAGSSSAAPANISVRDSLLVSTESSYTLVKPYNLVTVESDAGSRPDIITAFPNGVRETLGGGFFQQPPGTSKMKFSVPTFNQYACCDHIYRFTGSALGMGNVFGIQSDAEKFAEEDGYSYDYIAGTFFSFVAGTGYNFELSSRWPGIFAGCRMSMQATFFNSNGDKYNDTEGDSDKWGPVGRHIFTMNVVFEAANGSVYYFNGTIWTTSPVDLPCRVGGSDNYIYPLTQSMYPVVSPLLPNTFRRIPCKYITFDGLPCTVGRLVLKFYGYTYESTGGIADVKIKIERKEIPSANASVKDSNTYTLPDEYAIHDRIKNEWSEDMIFSSDNRNQFGMGTVVAQDNTLLSLVTEGDGNMYHPEQWRANMVYAFQGGGKSMLTLELDNAESDVANINHATRINRLSVAYLPIAISHYWRDSVKKIMAVRIGQSGATTHTVTLHYTANAGIVSVRGGGTVYDGDPVSISCVVDDGYAWGYWQDGNGNIAYRDQNYNIPAVKADMDLWAVAIADTSTFTVTIRSVPGVTSSGAGTYAVGTRVTISCVTDSSQTFSMWTEDDMSGPIISTSQSFQLTVNRNITLYPYTESATGYPRLYFGISEPGQGSIRKGTSSTYYYNGDFIEEDEGETEDFTAVPAEGYRFVKWQRNGEDYSTNQTVTIEFERAMNEDILTAVFAVPITDNTLRLMVSQRFINAHAALYVQIDNNAEVEYSFTSVNDAHSINVPEGSTVKLRCSWDDNFYPSQMNWLDDVTSGVYSSANPYTFTMNENKYITCNMWAG